jgi:hypothetical protein
LELWQSLRKEPRLDSARDLQFVGSAPICFASFGRSPALRLYRTADFIETDQRERISVGVFEPGEGATQVHSASPPAIALHSMPLGHSGLAREQGREQ